MCSSIMSLSVLRKYGQVLNDMSDLGIGSHSGASSTGTPFRDSFVTDLDGRRIQLSDNLTDTEQNVLIFSDLQCVACRRVLDAIRNRDERPEDRRKFIVILTNTRDEALAHLEPSVSSHATVVLEEGQVSSLYGINRFPSAMAYGPEMSPISVLTMGPDAVIALIHNDISAQT